VFLVLFRGLISAKNASFLERQVSTFNLTHGFKSLLTYYRNNRVPQTGKVAFAFNATPTNVNRSISVRL